MKILNHANPDVRAIPVPPDQETDSFLKTSDDDGMVRREYI